MGSSDERPVIVHRVRAREPWMLAFVASLVIPTLLIAGFVATNATLAGVLLLAGWQYVLGVVGVIAVSCYRRANKLEVEPAPTTARASEKGLFVDGGPLLDRGGITAAYVSPSWPEGAYVRVLRRGFASELWTADVEGAHALVASLGLDEQHVVGAVRGSARIGGRGSRFGAFLVALAAGIALSAVWSKLALSLPLLFVAWTILSFVPSVHVVGTDGVLTRWLGRRMSFVPIADIASVEPEPGRVVLHLRDGSEHELWIARRVGSADAATIGLSVSLLADRIRGAMRRAGTLEVDASSLARNGRELPAWLSSLRELGAQGTGYRAAVQREDLVFLVEDARRPPGIRIAAAVALGKTDPHERARIRIAAESSSMPEVREALEAALEADDDRVSDTLGRLDDEA